MMNFANKALTEHNNKPYVDRIAELEQNLHTLNEQYQTNLLQFSELSRKKRMNEDTLVNWFQDNLNESDDDSIIVSLDDINAILDYMGLGPLARERMWTVEGTATVPFSATVKATSRDEAHEMVENASFSLECNEYFDGFDCSHYDISVDITDVSPE